MSTKQDASQRSLMAEFIISLRHRDEVSPEQVWTQFEEQNRGALRWLGEARRNAIYQAICDLVIGDVCQVVDRNSLKYGDLVKITGLPTPEDDRYSVKNLDGWGALRFKRNQLEKRED